MKRSYKQQILMLCGAIAFITYFSIRFMPTTETESISVMDEQKQESIQIYVMDEEATLLPLSKEIPAGSAIEDKVKLMLASMCEDQVSGGFQGLLPTGTKAETVILQDGVLAIHFNETFTSYKKDLELRVLEAVTWGATQFQDVQRVELFVGDQLLSTMPQEQTPIANPLNRGIGINHFESATSSLHDSHTITVFYTKEMNGDSYFIPKSKRIAGDSTNMEVVVTEILKDVSATSQLSQPLYDNHIMTSDLPTCEDGVLVVNMNENLLDSDRSAKQVAYESLVLSLATTFQIDQVKVYVEENVITLHGSNEEALSVSSLLYNPIPF